MRRMAREFPMPSSCSDEELREFWNECIERHERYDRHMWSGEFDHEEFLVLEKRLAGLEELLDDINYEWSRRPWLQ